MPLLIVHACMQQRDDCDGPHRTSQPRNERTAPVRAKTSLVGYFCRGFVLRLRPFSPREGFYTSMQLVLHSLAVRWWRCIVVAVALRQPGEPRRNRR